jgi:hypothetical protein
MKVILAGGTGQIGRVLVRAFGESGDELVVLTRGGSANARIVRWDAKTIGPWAAALDGADVVINLAGRSVNCRYTPANLKALMRSRVESTRVIGEAIGRCERPPGVWLQMSTATIYAHRFDASNDETTGIIGGGERGAPAYWKWSIDIARAWEHALETADTPSTRKVTLRAAMVMSPDEGGIFDTLYRLSRLWLGGPVAGGEQYISWIHETDFARALRFLIERDDIAGAVNVAAPTPLPQREFMAAVRRAVGIPVGLPATKWMLGIGAFFMRSDTELLLKSRRVIPGRLSDAGFAFCYPVWPGAAEDLVLRSLRGASR